MMLAARVFKLAAAALLVAGAAPMAVAQQTQIIDEGGIRYQVTRQVIQRQVPVPEIREQQQTFYRQQVTTENIPHQQVYNVPVTQYQLVTRMHNRWNPFADPYYTYHYEPVTTWTQQSTTVQIPVSRVTWVPETKTVQAPTTTYRTAHEEITHRVALGPTPTGPATTDANRAIAQSTSTVPSPSATLAERPKAPVSSTPTAAGGQASPNESQGWRPPADSRYR